MKIAVLLATYNGELYLKELLDSVLNQSGAEFHCYVHDDGSKDTTPEILSEYQKKYPELLTILPGKSQGGACRNFMYLLRQTNAEYYMFCDQDDIWLPGKIQKFYQKMKKIESVPELPSLVFSDLAVVDEHLQEKNQTFMQMNTDSQNPEDYDFKHVLIRGKVPGCSMMLNRALRNAMLDLKSMQHIFMHDWWAMILAYGSRSQIGYIPETTMQYRIHSNNTVGIRKANALHALFHPERKKKKEWIQRPLHFALEASENKVLTSENKAFCRAFLKAAQGNKLQRAAFYYQHFKGVSKLWYMLLWI